MEQIDNQCHGKSSCQIQNPAQFVNSQSDPAFNKAECAGTQTEMFVQIGCVINNEQIHKRQLSGLFYACLVVFMCLSILNYLDYIKKIQENKYIEWDLKTITSGDYTVEFSIDPFLFRAWTEKEFIPWAQKQRQENNKEYISRVEAFRDWIQNEMEQRLDQLPDLGFEDEPVEHVKVALTTFAFKNAEIIHLLQERGEIIKNEEWSKMPQIDHRINEIKNGNLEDLMTPCSAFMTFENEEGLNRAMNFNETVNSDPNFADLGIWLNEFELNIEGASEPSDIIWENRHFTDGDRLKKKMIVIVIMALLLLSSFCLIYICASYSLKLLTVYPDVACESLPEYSSPASMQKAAIREWTINHAL